MTCFNSIRFDILFKSNLKNIFSLKSKITLRIEKEMVLTENQASSASPSLKLIIKAANQKYEDFIIENFHLDSTIKNLKKHINENYPKNPECQTIRLIYSGKLLHDHWTLKECIRHVSILSFF